MKMKNILIKSTVLGLTFLLLSCNVEEKFKTESVGGNVVLADNVISRLDVNNNIKLNVFTKPGVTVNKIEIFENIATSGALPKLGVSIASSTPINGIATFNSSKIKNYPAFDSNQDSPDGGIDMVFDTKYSDGTTTTNNYSITVLRGINFTDDKGNVLGSSGFTTVKYLDGTLNQNILNYATFKNYSSTIIDNVKVEWKKNLTGTYAPVMGTFPTTSGSLDLGTIPYLAYGLAIDDSLFYKFTVKSGSQTDYIIAELKVIM